MLPLYGSLRPSESQQFQFTFYGHPRIMAEATAVCSINGGPDYSIGLKGQASVMQYNISHTLVDFGKQVGMSKGFSRKRKSVTPPPLLRISMEKCRG